MSTIKTKKRRKNGRIYWPAVFLIISLVLIAIPTTAVGLILLDAFENTGRPLFGDRFKSEINQSITKDQLKILETALKNEAEVSKVTINLNSATLRVNVMMKNDLTENQAINLATNLYREITTELDPSTYFSMSGNFKQYDLELHVFNDRMVVDPEDFIYVIIHLNSTMSEPLAQMVSSPKNPDFVEALYQRIAQAQLQAEAENNEDDEDGE